MFKLELIPIDEEARNFSKFKWAPSDVGSRHQIGGCPTNVSENNYPRCPDCGKKMSFYGQFDSLNDDIIIADCGLIVVYICFDCLEVKAEIITS
jgi:DNA-directed RNA polymerase subunit RPC12/RpoP